MKNKYRFDLKIDDSLEENHIIIQSKSGTAGSRVMAHLEHLDSNHENLVIKQDDEFVIVRKTEIIFAEVYEKELTINTAEEEIRTIRTLASLLEELSAETFIQISRSSILNINSIRKVEPSFSGNLIARLTDGMKVSISRRYVKNLKQRLGI